MKNRHNVRKKKYRAIDPLTPQVTYQDGQYKIIWKFSYTSDDTCLQPNKFFELQTQNVKLDVICVRG